MVKEKQNDLTTILQFSKVQEMENRINELRKNQLETDKHLNLLEGIKKKQVGAIDEHNEKDAKSMEHINQYKNEFKELNN